MGLMKYLKTMMIAQMLVGYVFIASGFIVTFLMILTYIFVWPFSRPLYRKICINLAYSHWCQFTVLGQWWSGSDCTIFLHDPEDLKYVGKEHVIVLMNHKYDIDWLMAWILAERFSILGGTKIYGKSSLRMVPLLGWAWIFTESIFLKRQWEEDKRIITRDLKDITNLPDNYYITLLLFPEGTRFTEEKHKASNAVAREKGLPELDHHLLPRTKGFIISMHGVKGKVPAILDLTVGFRKDGAEPKLINVVNGNACHGEMYFRRIPLDSVPMESDEACAAWLHNLYQEKDKVYDNFAKNGRFTIGHEYHVPKRLNDLLMFGFWAVTLCTPLFIYLFRVIMSGSLLVPIVGAVVIGLASIGLREMIRVSETHSSSSTYGSTPTHRPKQQDNGPKKQQ